MTDVISIQWRVATDAPFGIVALCVEINGGNVRLSNLSLRRRTAVVLPATSVGSASGTQMN